MLSAERPTEVTLVATLDDSPRYRGTMHDHRVATARGYRGALIPGAFVYGYLSRLGVETWARAFAERGTIATRFRRPLYHGDRLTIRVAPLVADAAGVSAEASVVNQEGEEIATGAIGLRHAAASIDLAAFPFVPVSDPPRTIAPGGLVAGDRLSTRNAVLSEADFVQSLDDFGETHPLYREERVVHTGCLTRLAMADTYAGFRFPTPVILVAVAAEHLGLARPGDRLAVSGTVAAVSERKGQHYFDSDELLVANGTRPVARFRRTSIYAQRGAAE